MATTAIAIAIAIITASAIRTLTLAEA